MSVELSLQKLSGISNQFLKPLSLEDTYQVLLQEAKRTFDAHEGSIFLRFHKRWHRVYSTVTEEEQIDPKAYGYSYHVFTTHMPLLVQRKQFIKSHPEVKKATMQLIIIVPLHYNNQSLGIISLRLRQPKKLTPQLRQALQIYGSLATLAIKKTQLYEESKEALRVRDLFISLAAHELRTPLTTINAYVHLLQRKLQAANFPYVQWVQELSKETSLIIRTVNELLNVDLIQHGAFSYRMQPTKLMDLVRHAVRQFSLSYPFYTIRIESSLKNTQKIMADGDKLLQMLTSLLQNAIKFSSPEKEMVISVQETPRSFVVAVCDKGIGIPPQDIKQIFKGFYKGSNNFQDGIGLGLFLSKKIIEKHNGTIAVVSKKNKGTTVTVTFPKIL